MHGRDFGRLLATAALLIALRPVFASTPPDPAPDPAGPPNVWYGGVPAGQANAPVIVFVPGFGKTAAFFWTGGNTMYGQAYAAGYRTAFVDFAADNSPANGTIRDNAAALKTLVPKIASHFGASKVYLVGHCKGGVDIQGAMDASFQGLVKAVFNLAPPNQGTELADWAFGPGRNIAQQLGLLTPAFGDLRTASMASFRQTMDPILAASRIPFYTFAGTSYTNNPLLAVTGRILAALTHGSENDGIVIPSRTLLPSGYAADMGKRQNNHDEMGQATVSFPIIDGQIRSLEAGTSNFVRLSSNGFGDAYNTWAWSMGWFQGKLYVGTGRQEYCVELAATLVQNGLPLYPPQQTGDCTPDYHDLHLRAEVWQYTPDTQAWQRVYQSPQDVAYTASDGSVKYAAREFGYRGMQVFTESDGTQALYVAAVSTAPLFNKDPIYQTQPFPAPRMLRTIDGVNWAEVPHAPGTVLGDIAQDNPDVAVIGYRQFEVYKGQLYVTATDLRGQGFILASSNPAAGNNAWQRVSPNFGAMPVWALRVFNNFLYVGTGLRKEPTGSTGYGLFKTDASTVPYIYTPIIQDGGYQTDPNLLSQNVLNMAVFNNQLWFGTNQHPELVSVDSSDNWQIVVGEPRSATPQGAKAPLSGISHAFDNFFAVHFWELAVDGMNRLNFSTFDEGQGLYLVPIVSNNLNHDFGFDLYRSSDGVRWTVVTKNGLGDPWNEGGRTMLLTPIGFLLGTGRLDGGAQIWQDTSALGLNGDGIIDQRDVNAVSAAVGTTSGGFDRRDVDHDGRITVQDVKYMRMVCAYPGCASSPAGAAAPAPAPATPQNLSAAPGPQGAGGPVVLSWDPAPGGVAYRIYRWRQDPASAVLAPSLLAGLPCTSEAGEGGCPASSPILEKWTFLVEPEQVGSVGGTSYSETAPTNYQSLYFVRAEDAQGNLSAPSNTVGAPSKAFP